MRHVVRRQPRNAVPAKCCSFFINGLYKESVMFHDPPRKSTLSFINACLDNVGVNDLRGAAGLG
jgi:hypothetical protein